MLAGSFTVFMVLAGVGMILPLLPFYASSFGASPFRIGLLFASYSLAQFVCSPLWGRVSDRVGRRRPLLLSIVIAAVAYILLASATTLAMVFIARILAGAAAANYTIAQAVAADLTKPDRAVIRSAIPCRPNSNRLAAISSETLSTPFGPSSANRVRN